MAGPAGCAKTSRTHADPSAWQEATCPVCVAATLIADRVPALADLTGRDPARPDPARLDPAAPT